MGQANKRGTFEQRQALAIERNKAVEASLAEVKDQNAPIVRAHKRMGTQRLVTALLVAGILSHGKGKV